MAHRIILLSGPIAGGKSALGDRLVERYGLVQVKTRELIRQARPGTRNQRKSLQRAGDRLDRETNGRWIAEELARLVQRLPEDATVLVDAVRITGQIDAIRATWPYQVVHIHVTAPLLELARRYSTRAARIQELPDYKDVRQNRTERRVEELAAHADVVIDSARCSEGDVFTRAASFLGFFGRQYEPRVDVLVGGQWGSEGKGHIASYLAPEYQFLIRVGGPNAGHTVYEGPSRTYTFHLLPSGTRHHKEAKLILGPGAVLNVEQLLREIADCEVDFERLSIDPNAMVITQEDVDREVDLVSRIGSTGQGTGSATARKIQGRDGAVQLAGDHPDLKPFVRDTQEILERAYRDGAALLLEGTQGTGLSLHHGPYPYVTSRDTTVSGCLSEAGIAPARVRRVVMLCRTYPIRVESPQGGTSGPMGTEIEWQTVADRSGLSVTDLVAAEKTSTTKRRRRVAEFSWEQLRASAALNAPTDIALTFADYLSRRNMDARRFEQLEAETIRFIEEVERVAMAPASLIATRFHERSIIDRRSWGTRP